MGTAKITKVVVARVNLIGSIKYYMELDQISPCLLLNTVHIKTQDNILFRVWALISFA